MYVTHEFLYWISYSWAELQSYFWKTKYILVYPSRNTLVTEFIHLCAWLTDCWWPHLAACSHSRPIRAIPQLQAQTDPPRRCKIANCWHHDLKTFSNTMMFFSKWAVQSPSSGPSHVHIAWIPTPATWHMVWRCLVLLRVSNYYWMCLVSVQSRLEMPLCSACNPVWVALDSPTKMFSILQPNVFCYISPVHSDRIFELSV